jgi:FeS assembly SUF system regulator
MLRITKLTDYGVVLMTHFAQRPTPAVLAAKDIAAETHIPFPMVSKILKLLVRHELLVSHRGTKGGYTLARPPESTTLADIIFALEGPIAMTECADDEHAGDCRIERSCAVRVNWQRISHEVRAALARVTLAEMSEPGCGGTACGHQLLMPGAVNGVLNV